MAIEPGLETNASADMDYPEHEKTYALFLNLFKWGVVVVISILCGLAMYALAGAGALGGFATFLIVLGAAYFLAR